MWNTLKAFYDSDEWKEFRELVIAKRKPICEKCGKVIVNSKNVIVHHKIELTIYNVNDTNISLNEDNVIVVDFDCHNKIHKRFGYNIKKNERGIYLVYGPPCSGKNTFVAEHKDRMDIVVDMDSLYEAVTSLPRYDKPNNLRFNVMAIRNCILDNIKTRYGNFNNAWIIGGYPEGYKRNRLLNDLGAIPIFIEVDKEECLRRLKNVEDIRKYMYKEWESYINDWFEKYSE